MKTNILLKGWLVLMTLPLAALAQPDYNNNTNPPNPNDDMRWGPHKGSNEFTISGSGSSNKRMTNSLGGANLSFGNYVGDTTEVLLRQEVDYTHPQGSSAQWDGATKLALDQDLIKNQQIRPFLGANVGGVYGRRVRDTWVAGLEGGAKYYAMAKAFIFAEAEYDWFFRHAHGLVSRSKFNDGEWNWSVGVGFDF